MEAIAQGEPNKRGFTYLMLGGMRVAIATSGRVALLKLLGQLHSCVDVFIVTKVVTFWCGFARQTCRLCCYTADGSSFFICMQTP